MKRTRSKWIAAWAVWVGLGLSGCSPKEFERNPNLHLVVKHEGVYLIEPVWTTKGRVFYLESADIYHFGGKLYSVNWDGTDDRCLDPNGRYNSMDASRTRDTVVLAKSGRRFAPDTLMLMDSDGNVLKNIPVGIRRLRCVRLNWDETHIYFSTDSADPPGIYRVEIDSPYTVELIKANRVGWSFEVGYGDTLIFMDFPRINPTDPNYVVGTTGGWGLVPSAIILMNITTADSVLLDWVIAPYEYDYMAGYCYPNWSPDGKQIIFSVGPDGGVENGWMPPFEIWRLENASELLPRNKRRF